MRRTVLNAFLGLTLALAACASQPPNQALYNPYPPPPPLRAESLPPTPVTGQQLIWQPGSWAWDGQGGYVWQPGAYVPVAGHGPTWTYGYWDRVAGVWTWVPAHWS